MRKVIKSKIFDGFIITLIVINSLLLALVDYENPNSNSIRNQIGDYAEPFFTTMFTIEAWIKILALGFICNKNAYLRDPWNWLDFIVVITSLLSILPDVSNMSMIRTFRLFRPLRSFTSLPKMKSIISTMLGSMAKLGEIMIVAVIFFYIFSVLGLSLWNGKIHYRCRVTPQPVDGDWQVVTNNDRNCGYRDCSVGYCGSLVEQYTKYPDTLSLDKIGSIYRYSICLN